MYHIEIVVESWKHETEVDTPYTENNDTDYQSGTEFHLDFTANQFLSETFALGVRGYYYNQFTGDSGSGARLGDFQGESFGLGPGFIWFPAFADAKLAVLG